MDKSSKFIKFEIKKGAKMKINYFSYLIIVIYAISTSNLFSQNNDEDKFNPFKEDPRLKYYNKNGYEYTMNYSFERVYNACKSAIEELGCQIITQSYNQTDEGFYKGKIFSDYCVFIGKTDTTFDNLERYCVKVPIIRGGVWVNGRMQYKFIINENQDGTTHLKLKGEISGREDYVTSKVHFFESNGFFEHQIMERINAILAEQQ